MVKVVREHKGESLNWCKWFDAEHEFPFGKSLLLVQRLIREDYHREELKRAFHLPSNRKFQIVLANGKQLDSLSASA